MHDYPVADLPRQLTTVRSLRRKNEEVSEVLAKSQALVGAHDSPIDVETQKSISHIAERYVKAGLINSCVEELFDYGPRCIMEMFYVYLISVWEII